MLNPVYRSLSIPRSYFGTPIRVFLIHLSVCSFPILAFKFIEFIGFFFVLQIIGAYFSKKDVEWISIYIQYSRQADQYGPSLPHSLMTNRPDGFLRKMLKKNETRIF